jgi:hypothetical protein
VGYPSAMSLCAWGTGFIADSSARPKHAYPSYVRYRTDDHMGMY